MNHLSKRIKATLNVELLTCAFCQKPMIHETLARSGIFEKYMHGETLERQMEKEGWAFRGVDVPGTERQDYACKECTEAGKVTFKCAICEQERTSDLINEDMYREPECKICYETMTAKAWDEWHSEQSHRHEWYYSS